MSSNPPNESSVKEPLEEYVMVKSALKTVETSGPSNSSQPEPSTESAMKRPRVVVQREEEADEDEEGVEEETSGDPPQNLADHLPDDSEDINLIHCRLKTCDELNLPRFASSLKRLCLRQNFISALEKSQFSPLQVLEELDFYDNKIKNIGTALNDLPQLITLDLSFNLLKAVPECLATLPSLKTAYFVQNRIAKITNLSIQGSIIRSLELGGNRIRVIEGLESLLSLEELWLGKNKITKLENLSKLVKLKILSIQSNRIVKIEGLECLTELEEIYFSHNGVERLENLENNLKLQTIDVGNNRISRIENISHLAALEEFWANDNQIPDLKDLEEQLGSIKSLKTIYLEHNPCQKHDEAGYKRKIILALPQLEQIDATYVKKS